MGPKMSTIAKVARLSVVVREYVTYNIYTVVHCLCIIAVVTYHLVVGEHVRLLFQQQFLAVLPQTARDPLVLMDIFLQATWSVHQPRGPFPRAKQRLYHELLLAGICCYMEFGLL